MRHGGAVSVVRAVGCCLALLSGAWWRLVVLGGAWWCLVVVDDAWWCLVVLAGAV